VSKDRLIPTRNLGEEGYDVTAMTSSGHLTSSETFHYPWPLY